MEIFIQMFEDIENLSGVKIVSIEETLMDTAIKEITEWQRHLLKTIGSVLMGKDELIKGNDDALTQRSW